MINAVGDAQSLLLLGGSSDIGQAVIRRYAASGRLERVVLAGRPGPRLEAAASAVRDLGVGTVETVDLDNDDLASHPAAVDAAFAGGDLDVVVLAAAVLADQDRAETDAAYAAEVFTTNLTGPVSLATLVSGRLRAQGHGTLVVLSSVAGERARRTNYVYGATKAGLDAFASGLSDALLGSGAHVLVVRPGFVTSRMTEGLTPPPGPFSTTADVVADAVFDGVRRHRQLVWAPAPLRLAMSVLRHAPRPLFRKLPG